MAKKYTPDEAKKCIEERITFTDTAWRPTRDMYSEIYSLYRFFSGTDAEAARGERSNIFIPLAFANIETKLPRIVQSLIGQDDWFKAFARSGRDVKNAEWMTKVMRFQLNDEINSFFPLMMWWKECMIYGNSYMFVGWNRETANIKRRFPNFFGSEIIGYDYRSEEETTYDSVSLNHLDLWDCFPAPFGKKINGTRFERMPYFLLRSEPSAEYLRQLASKQDLSGQSILDKKAVEDIIRRFPQGTGDVEKERRDRMSFNRMVETNHRDTYAPRYVMWTMFEPDWWVSIIENTIVRNNENPYGDNKIPIAAAFDTPVPHEHMAIGQIEPIIKLQYYANDLENIKLDYLMKATNPGGLINQESFLDPTKFQDDPDGIHLVKGDPRLAYMTTQNTNFNLTKTENEQVNLERLMDKTLGQSDVSRGQSRTQQDTATEIVALIEQANFRFDLSIRLLKNESLTPMLELIASRNQLFWQHGKEIIEYDQSGQEQFIGIPVSRIIGDFRFKMLINPIQGNKFAYAQTLIRFLDVVNNSQGQNPNLVKEIAKFLQIDNFEQLMDDKAKQALLMIVQAAKEGLLENSKQASAVLGGVLNVLAPKGSPEAAAISATTGTGKSSKAGNPAQDERGIAAQMGQGMK